MVSPLFKKNTLEQASFKFTDSGFSYRGVTYDFEEVVEVVRYRHVLETKRLIVGSEYTHSISILFAMNSGENIQLTEQPTFLSSSKIEKIEEVENIFDIVSRKTFQNRAKKYLERVDNQGFYEYSGWHFYPDKRKIVNVERKRAYQIDSIKMLKSFGFIQIVNIEESISEKVSRKINGNVGINTITNTDVFFALLNHFFNIRWKD